MGLGNNIIPILRSFMYIMKNIQDKFNFLQVVKKCPKVGVLSAMAVISSKINKFL